MANNKKRAVTGFSAILVVLLGIAILFYVSFTTVVVTGNSMEPTFESGDRLLASSAYWLVGPLRKKDIVVVRAAGNAGYFIKRIYGLGGDVIDYMNVPDSHRLSDGEYRVPPGHVFVVGDNREVSEDSRRFGPVPVADVLGKIVVRR